MSSKALIEQVTDVNDRVFNLVVSSPGMAKRLSTFMKEKRIAFWTIPMCWHSPPQVGWEDEEDPLPTTMIATVCDEPDGTCVLLLEDILKKHFGEEFLN